MAYPLIHTDFNNMDLLCFSHLRWKFVFQRPQHLLSRCAKTFRTFYIEEPVFSADEAELQVEKISFNLYIVTPLLPTGLAEAEIVQKQQELLADLRATYNIESYMAWFYTPMALPLLDGMPKPASVIYDCMDELSGFNFAPPEVQAREAQLLQIADVVFTGGQSLFEAKKHLHRNIHAFPSSIDKEHFTKARAITAQPPEQYHMQGPRIGFFGVIDERMDIGLLREIATRRPDWNLILIGPVVKIDPEILPRLPNIHYLGSKSYEQLPDYLGGWDVALLPFALNESTRFISPTKTPEYLAGGVPVVSTPIPDVIDPYGSSCLVYIGKDTEHFIDGIASSIGLKESTEWINAVDSFLKDVSWDNTWDNMLYQLKKVLNTQSSLTKQYKSLV